MLITAAESYKSHEVGIIIAQTEINPEINFPKLIYITGTSPYKNDPRIAPNIKAKLGLDKNE